MNTFAAMVAGIALAAAAHAPASAADCSAGAIADKPVGGTVDGKPFVPNAAQIDFTRNGMGVDGAKFDRYVLHIQTDGIFNELNVDMLVPSGKKPDGRVFRVLPTDSIGAQPSVVKGVPEVQGWELELDDQGIRASFTEDIASIRVEFGQAKNGIMPGKIHLCVPGRNADIEGRFAATLQ
jgi:hypothetical protein